VILNNYTQASPDAQAGVSSTPAHPSLANSFNNIIIKAYREANVRWIEKIDQQTILLWRKRRNGYQCADITQTYQLPTHWVDTVLLNDAAIPIVEHDIVEHDITDDQVAEWTSSYAGLTVDLDPIIINPNNLTSAQVQVLAEAQAEGAEWFMVVGDEIVVYRTHAIPFCSDYEYASIWPPIDDNSVNDSPDTLIWLDYDGSLPDRVIELKTYFEPIIDPINPDPIDIDPIDSDPVTVNVETVELKLSLEQIEDLINAKTKGATWFKQDGDGSIWVYRKDNNGGYEYDIPWIEGIRYPFKWESYKIDLPDNVIELEAYLNYIDANPLLLEPEFVPTLEKLASLLKIAMDSSSRNKLIMRLDEVSVGLDQLISEVKEGRHHDHQ